MNVAPLILLLALAVECPVATGSNGADAAPPESSPSSPPLATDDPDTPGTGGYEINLISSCDKSTSDHTCQVGVDAAFGLGEKAQLRISKYRLWERTAGEQPLNGVGPSDVGIKYRFFDGETWRLATFPSLDLDDETRRYTLTGTPVEREGRSLYLPLIVSHSMDSPIGTITTVANLAYRRNLQHTANDSTFAALAVGKAVSDDSRIMAEATTECTAHWGQCRKDMRAGIVSRLPRALAPPYEAALFASVGLGWDPQGEVHRTVLLGLSLARSPQ